MVKVQVTLTPNEAKRLIAKAVSQMPLIREALKNGKILLKGGTTVSAVTEELAGRKLPISGRITPKGTKGSITGLSTLHRLLLDHGEPKGLETESDSK